jgi:hypothetical protein
MSTGSSLNKARKAKQDEFYTLLSDIESELAHYSTSFKDKVVYCNCDNPISSNFYTYFFNNFKTLNIKKLITTHLTPNSTSSVTEYDGVKAITSNLTGNGDFRSEECIELLKQADIVVTNPPFSLFREYVAQLIEYDKTFLIMGNLNAITCMNIFKLIKDSKLWLGYRNGVMSFKVPDTYTGTCKGVAGNKQAMVSVCWYTNLLVNKSNNLTLTKTYNAKDYPKYDNYDAINVNKIKDIPMDYDGVMGVPITFLQNYNPAQFEIIGNLIAGGNARELGATKTDTFTGVKWNGAVINKQRIYARLIIKRLNKLNKV